MKLDARVVRLGAVALCAMALVACGGDDDKHAGGTSIAPPAPPAPAPTVVTGKVDAPFVAGSTARFVSMGMDTAQGPLNGVTQDTNGAFQTIGAFRSANAAEVGGISGNASFALGSWVGKVVNATTGVEVNAPNAMSYAVFNRSTVARADGTLACTPHITSARIAIGKGESLAGSATMTIAEGVISVSGELAVKQADGNSVPVVLDNRFSRIDSTTYVGLIAPTSKPIEYSLTIGDGANDGHVVVMPWKLNTANGAQYGVAVLDCKRPA
ncbi:hypothetical protein [Cupriavidus agavae]|uniref:Uncharacterized protein n=1 Tax=Cupriavidus agavae TaxID=1001822 RepID=A0A4V2FH12_9BURK|nr:hypothetical protein [Cupriavidus agavae]RZT38669.1 hypothetical protein EV147_3142 [Cupriavidus agavae]